MRLKRSAFVREVSRTSKVSTLRTVHSVTWQLSPSQTAHGGDGAQSGGARTLGPRTNITVWVRDCATQKAPEERGITDKKTNRQYICTL